MGDSHNGDPMTNRCIDRRQIIVEGSMVGGHDRHTVRRSGTERPHHRVVMHHVNR